MRMRIPAVAALAGSLFLAPAIMGQANAGVPDTKGAFGTIEGDVTLVGRGACWQMLTLLHACTCSARKGYLQLSWFAL